VIPATVSFVAPKAQFTPREVETRTEREKLMFRLKVKADGAWLAAHRDLAKGGMPGVATVRLEASAPWPANLQINGK
jgi:HlyD family secretion protein